LNLPGRSTLPPSRAISKHSQGLMPNARQLRSNRTDPVPVWCKKDRPPIRRSTASPTLEQTPLASSLPAIQVALLARFPGLGRSKGMGVAAGLRRLAAERGDSLPLFGAHGREATLRCLREHRLPPQDGTVPTKQTSHLLGVTIQITAAVWRNWKIIAGSKRARPASRRTPPRDPQPCHRRTQGPGEPRVVGGFSLASALFSHRRRAGGGSPTGISRQGPC